MSFLKLLGFRVAARKSGMSVVTLKRWRGEGMTVVKRGSEVLVTLDTVFAWKRWKSLNNPKQTYRRRAAAARGEVGAIRNGNGQNLRG